MATDLIEGKEKVVYCIAEEFRLHNNTFRVPNSPLIPGKFWGVIVNDKVITWDKYEVQSDKEIS